jgi:large subunit ribosomal protein L22
MKIIKAEAKSVRGSPRKVRMVAFQVRGMSVDRALAALQYTTKRAAHDVWKVVKSAAANAEHNFGMNPTEMIISEVYVDPAPTFKRGRAASRGRYRQILKRNSHIRIILARPEDLKNAALELVKAKEEAKIKAKEAAKASATKVKSEINEAEVVDTKKAKAAKVAKAAKADKPVKKTTSKKSTK